VDTIGDVLINIVCAFEDCRDDEFDDGKNCGADGFSFAA